MIFLCQNFILSNLLKRVKPLEKETAKRTLINLNCGLLSLGCNSGWLIYKYLHVWAHREGGEKTRRILTNNKHRN